MNLIKNFFHAFGDIIFGLAVVVIAVFLIGTQINDDFDIFALGDDAYNKVVSTINGDDGSVEPTEILVEPDSNDSLNTKDDIPNEDILSKDVVANSNSADNTLDTTDDVSDNNSNVTAVDKTNADNTDEDQLSTNDLDTKENKIVPPPLPKIRNVQISSGSTAQEVASGLFANEIIASKEDFLAEYARLPEGRSIKSGKFEIPTGSTLTEILSIIAP